MTQEQWREQVDPLTGQTYGWIEDNPEEYMKMIMEMLK